MWQKTKHGLYKQFVFADFHDAWAFMQRVAKAANMADHHPRWQNEWNVVDVWLSTHSNNGVKITEKDADMAAIIDSLESGDFKQTVVKKSTNIEELQLYADGGSRGNPGPSSSGYVLLNMSGEVVLEGGKYIGITTNNQAEYEALRLGMEHALYNFHAKKLYVYMDSMLVINQMKGIFKLKNKELWPVHDACEQLANQFDFISFDHIPRELNRRADAEVNRILNEALHKPLAN